IEESAIPMPKPTARAAQAATAATAPPLSRPAAQPNAGAAGSGGGAPGAGPGVGSPAQLSDLTLEQLARLIVNKMPSPKSGASRVDIFTQLEGAIVRAALERTRGNKQAAANLLGLYRPRLYSMLRKHNLHDTIRESEQNTAEPDLAEDDLIDSEPLNQDPNQDPDGTPQLNADPEPPKESPPPKEASKEPSGEDVVGTPNINGPDAAEFHFRKGVPYQY
ncbi:MAG TPA: helix-turn-helix domain-containing protein, partial [Blastocatellia bacterium]|nr:helix-turn-helix domain-containing protein [Blastocatellia bacterium]